MRNDQLLSARTHTFSGTDVWDLVRLRAQRSADQIAFVWHPYHGSPREWTYRELARDAAGLAAGLNIVHGAVVHPAVAHELGLPVAA